MFLEVCSNRLVNKVLMLDPEMVASIFKSLFRRGCDPACEWQPGFFARRRHAMPDDYTLLVPTSRHNGLPAWWGSVTIVVGLRVCFNRLGLADLGAIVLA
jgi:hypothetical protein